MTEKTEEQIAKEREATEAMKNAKSNMDRVLARVETLTRVLQQAKNDLALVKDWVPQSAYGWRSDTPRHTEINNMIANIQKVL